MNSAYNILGVVPGAVRWVIKADGVIVGYEYSSERKARERAIQYAMECEEQDDPWFPKMTVEEERIE